MEPLSRIESVELPRDTGHPPRAQVTKENNQVAAILETSVVVGRTSWDLIPGLELTTICVTGQNILGYFWVGLEMSQDFMSEIL